MSGLFIVLEGPDGAGKSTQAALLVNALRAAGRSVLHTAEPMASPVGRLIREAMGAGRTANLPYLFAADRAEHLSEVVEPALAQGVDVVCDRYIPSSIAYQSLDGADPGHVLRLNAMFRRPDLTLLLDLPADVATARLLARGGVQHWETERADRVGIAYHIACLLLQGRGWRWRVIDATGSPEDVHAACWSAVAQCLSKAPGRAYSASALLDGPQVVQAPGSAQRPPSALARSGGEDVP